MARRSKLSNELMKAVEPLPALVFVAGEKVLDRLQLVQKLGIGARRDHLDGLLRDAALGSDFRLKIVRHPLCHGPHRGCVIVV